MEVEQEAGHFVSLPACTLSDSEVAEAFRSIYDAWGGFRGLREAERARASRRLKAVRCNLELAPFGELRTYLDERASEVG